MGQRRLELLDLSVARALLRGEAAGRPPGPEQGYVHVGGDLERDSLECGKGRGEIHRGESRQGPPTVGQPTGGLRSCSECLQQARSTVAGPGAPYPDDDPPGSGRQGSGHQLPDAARGRTGRVPKVGGHQVQPRGGRRLDPCRAVVGHQVVGHDRTAQWAGDRHRVARASAPGADRVEEPRPAVRQRAQHQVVPGGDARPALSHRRRGLRGRERARERVRAHQNLHERAVWHPVPPTIRRSSPTAQTLPDDAEDLSLRGGSPLWPLRDSVERWGPTHEEGPR